MRRQGGKRGVYVVVAWGVAAALAACQPEPRRPGHGDGARLERSGCFPIRARLDSYEEHYRSRWPREAALLRFGLGNPDLDWDRLEQCCAREESRDRLLCREVIHAD